MHTRTYGVVQLEPVHAKVVTLILGMLRVHERQRDKRAAILLPRGENRQTTQVGWLLQHLQHGTVLDIARPELQRFQRQVAVLPKCGQPGRQDSLGKVNHLLDQLLGLCTKGQLNTLRSSKQVGGDRNRAALHSVEQERRAAALDNAAMDFCNLEKRIDLYID